MLDRILAFVAFGVLVAFLAILVVKVARVDLIVVVGITLALAGWDFFARRRGG